MAFTLEKVVPWGRSYGEYLSMFALTQTDLEGRILGCGDGPSGFNSILTKRGGRIVSADPVYAFTAEEIRSRIEDTRKKVVEQTQRNRHEFVWKHISSIEELVRVRTAAMEEFLSDYPEGKAEGRYIEASLPDLPFGDYEFDLALCSHFLFLYSEHYTEQFHFESLIELCRVSREVRVFPLVELGAGKSRHLAGVVSRLRATGLSVEVMKVDYEFKRGANEMLRIYSN